MTKLLEECSSNGKRGKILGNCYVMEDSLQWFPKELSKCSSDSSGPSFIFVPNVCIQIWQMLKGREDQHHIPYQDNILHKPRIAFSLLPQQECSGCSNTKGRALIRNKNLRSHTEDTGNSSISYSINFLVSKFSSERDHILFPNYVAYVSS